MITDIQLREKNIGFYEERGKMPTKATSSLSFCDILKGDYIVMLESKFKTELIGELEEMFPGCIVVHLDPNEIQGIPDLIVLYKDKWAALEGKRSEHDPHQPNQDFYVNLMDQMSFAAFIYPENKEEVLDELQQTFKPYRTTRISRR